MSKKIDQVIEGLQILKKYSSLIDAQHDVIYAGGDYEKTSEEDRVSLGQLGWFYGKDVDSWAIFT